jgi:hypothetical protein
MNFEFNVFRHVSCTAISGSSSRCLTYWCWGGSSESFDVHYLVLYPSGDKPAAIQRRKLTSGGNTLSKLLFPNSTRSSRSSSLVHQILATALTAVLAYVFSASSSSSFCNVTWRNLSPGAPRSRCLFIFITALSTGRGEERGLDRKLCDRWSLGALKNNPRGSVWWRILEDPFPRATLTRREHAHGRAKYVIACRVDGLLYRSQWAQSSVKQNEPRTVVKPNHFQTELKKRSLKSAAWESTWSTLTSRRCFCSFPSMRAEQLLTWHTMWLSGKKSQWSILFYSPKYSKEKNDASFWYFVVSWNF